MRWVRPIISFSFSGGIIYGFVKGLVEPKDFLIIATGVIVWWFTARDKTKKTTPW